MACVGYYSSLDVRSPEKPQLETSQSIQFNKQYAAPPRIVPGLAQLDFSRATNIRVATWASDITTTGFVMHSDSWRDTVNYSVNTNYLELAPAAVDFQSGKFSTKEDRAWDRPQEKSSCRIKFAYPYVTPPKVLSFISEFDIRNDTNFRLRTYVSDIDTDGFTIHLESWGGTRLYSMEAYWIAYPGDRENTFSTTFNTTDVRPRDKLQLNTSNAICFGEKCFDHQPQVFVALNSFDVDNCRNLRLRTYVDRVNKAGLTWHVNGWDDTVVYSGGGVILAFV